MCDDNPTYVDPALGHPVVRIWSNAQAEAGHDPCVPHPSGDVYFIAAPHLDEIALDNLFGIANSAPIVTPGLQIPIGTQRTIDVHLLSDQSTAQMSVSAIEWPADASVALSDLDLSWDRTTGTNGDTLHLTITALGDSAGLGHEFFYIQSQLGDATHTWPVAVAF
jgi:hypothetical protein